MAERSAPPAPHTAPTPIVDRAPARDLDADRAADRTATVTGGGVDELRLVVTTDDLDAAIHAYGDVLGMPQLAAYGSEGGRVVILDAGRATLELADDAHAAHVDDVEVGRRVAGPIRVALRVADVGAATDALGAAGATLIAPPTRTPWGSRNSRLDAAGELQLTLFEDDPVG